jgi:serine/threonine-protein kinase
MMASVDAIPGYTIMRPLGRGGMAMVYLAVQESLGREVALKILSPSQDDTAGERFLREARIAANLHHPNIVPIHDFGVHEGVAYIAMAYEPSGTISLLAGERLEPRAALRLVRDIASALDYAHGRGVVHRDIKPDNILRRADGAGVLSDFGIARLIQGESQLTTEGTSVGTPHYMSPEQLRGEKVDGRSDLYSLGVVLWQLLTGDLPYVGGDSWAIGTQHLTAEIPRLPPSLAHIQGLLDALLAKKADARPATGADVIRWIDGLLAAGTTPATVPSHPSQPGSSPILQKPDRSQPRIAWIVAGLVLLLALAWLGWRQFGPALPGEAPESAAASPKLGPVAPTIAAPPSIAVLPLEDLSEAHDQSYFSDGIAEELSNRLAQVPGMRVAGRTSSQSFQGKGATIAQIGKALNVTNVLEGSVRKDGDRLRVTMQLNNVADGFQIWSQSYDRKLTDIFAVQEEIASAVVDSLKLKLLQSGNPRGHTPSFEVYDLYLRGRQGLIRGDYPTALEALRKAAALDPEYARAFSVLAMAEVFSATDINQPQLMAQAQARAMVAAERAVALDPTLGDGFGARGYLRARKWDWNGALADAEQSVNLEPGEGRNHLRLGFILSSLNRLDEARAVLEQGSRADPLLTPVWYWLGRVEAAQGNYAGARKAFDRVQAIDPRFMESGADMGGLALLEGDPASARKSYLDNHVEAGVLMADHDLGKSEQAVRSMDALAASEGKRDPYGTAVAYAWMGEKTKAFEWLDRAYAVRSFGMQTVSFDPFLRSLRNDPRYDLLLKKLGLPEQSKAAKP